MTRKLHSPWQRPDGSASSKGASLVDPEDDLPSADYAGDFETTTIPAYDSRDSRVVGVASSGLNLLGDPEPLPYVQADGGVGRAGQVQPPGTDSDDRWRADDRRGTQDLGLLVLRVGLGAVLVLHGLRKLFGWWGGPGLAGFRNALSDTGYQHADILGYVAAGGLIVAGVLLVLGLFTPLAAAGALAYLLNGVLAGMSADGGWRHFAVFLPDGHEYHLALAVMAVAVVLIGPGRYGLDGGRGWARRPFIGSMVALVAGVAGGIGLWMLLNGANPL